MPELHDYVSNRHCKEHFFRVSYLLLKYNWSVRFFSVWSASCFETALWIFIFCSLDRALLEIWDILKLFLRNEIGHIVFKQKVHCVESLLFANVLYRLNQLVNIIFRCLFGITAHMPRETVVIVSWDGGASPLFVDRNSWLLLLLISAT